MGRDRVRKLDPKKLHGFDRPFVAWDGEGITDRDTGRHYYTLLANSLGEWIENPEGLGTLECLRFLCRPRGGANHVWFFGDYDITCILRDLPLYGERHSFEDLVSSGFTIWRDFRIRWIPGKLFLLSYLPTGDSFKSTDASGFYQSSFVKALRAWNIEVPDEIATGKAHRDEFWEWYDTDEGRVRVREYNAEECRLLVVLLDRLREALRAADLRVTSWHGAGAIAAAWLRREGAQAWLGNPYEREARIAYHGGRQESSFIGQIDGVYHYDLNSAYPWANTLLPDLSSLSWHSGTTLKPYGLYRVRWSCPEYVEGKRAEWYPLPWRAPGGHILYPPRGEGWYHECEVRAAMDLWPGCIEVLDGRFPVGDLHLPWSDPIHRDFAVRNQLKQDTTNPDHAAHVPIKLALNSLYGKLAQGTPKPAHDDEPKRPRWQCYYGAGFITAYVRAELLRVMREIGRSSVLVCATDGIYTLAPLKSRIGKGLGQWSLEEEGVSMLSCGSGLYATFEGDKARIYRSRGIPSQMNYAWILRSWGCSTSLRMDGPEQCWSMRTFFVGPRIALAAPSAYESCFASWVELRREIKNVLINGSGKRWPGANLLRPPGWKRTYLVPVAMPERTKDRLSAMYTSGSYEESLFEMVDRMTVDAEAM